jgi:hypothetical protein
MTMRLTTDHHQSGPHNSAAQSDQRSQRFHQTRTEILMGQLKFNHIILQFNAIKKHAHMQDHDVNTDVRKRMNKKKLR